MATIIECVGCGREFRTEAAFDHHGPSCTSGGRHKPLGELSYDELQAVLTAELVREGNQHPDPAGMLSLIDLNQENA